MRKMLLFICAFGLQGLVYAQRSIDLQVEITSIQDGDVFDLNEIANLMTKITNLGADDLTSADTLCYYQIINGDTVPMTMLNLNYFPYTDYSAGVDDDFTISRPTIFSNGFGGSMFDFCIYIVPKNGVNEIIDPDLSNNTHCVTISVNESNLAIDESSASQGNIYPNPASTYFSVSSNQEWLVYNLQGELIPIEREGNKILCENWKSGVYLVHSFTESGGQIQKLVVQH